MQKFKSLVLSVPVVFSEQGLCFFAFALPFLFAGPQLLIGTLVNAILVLAAREKIAIKKSLRICFLPAFGVITRGTIFGPQTIFLIYFLPFLWLGNFIFLALHRQLNTKMNAVFLILLPAAAKFIFLFALALIYFHLRLVPASFLTVMGENQLITAFLGGSIIQAVRRKQ